MNCNDNVTVFEPVVTAGENELSALSYSLSLDSSTTIYIYVNTPSDYTGSITATCDGKELTAEKIGKSYRFAIPDINASELSYTYTVNLTSDNDSAEVGLSALSYVCTVLNSDLGQPAIHAVSAFYKYYEASRQYIMNLDS